LNAKHGNGPGVILRFNFKANGRHTQPPLRHGLPARRSCSLTTYIPPYGKYQDGLLPTPVLVRCKNTLCWGFNPCRENG